MIKKAELRLNELRGIGIIAVLLIHTSALILAKSSSVKYFLTPTDTWLILAINQWARFSVPLFFVITGMVVYYNYQATESSYLDFIKRRIKYVIIPYVAWVPIYGYIRVFEGFWGGSSDLLINTITGRVSYHTYFLAVLVQFYLLYPLLKKVLTPKLRILTLLSTLGLLALMIIAMWTDPSQRSTWPGWVNSMINLNNHLLWWLFYFILGVFLADKWPKLGQEDRIHTKYLGNSRLVMLAGFTLFLGLWGLMTAKSVWAYNNWYEGYGLTTNFFKFSVVAYTVVFIYLCYQLLKLGFSSRSLEWLGANSFGIYISHSFFLFYIDRYVKRYWGSSMISFIVMTITLFVVSILFTWISSRLNLFFLSGRTQPKQYQVVGRQGHYM